MKMIDTCCHAPIHQRLLRTKKYLIQPLCMTCN